MLVAGEGVGSAYRAVVFGLGVPGGQVVNRREFLAAASSSALLARPAFAQGTDDRALRATLDGLGNATPEAKLERLKLFSPSTLSQSSALDLVTARSGLRIDAQLALRFPFGRLGHSPYSVSSASGAWRESHPNAAKVEADTAAIEADAAMGVVLPTPLLRQTIAAIRGALSSTDQSVSEAMLRQASTLERLLPSSGDAPGVCRLRDGGDYFALLLERHTGERVDAEAAHARFVDTWHQLHARADRVLRRQGLTRGSVGERIIACFRQEKWLYSDDDAGRDRAVADMNQWLDHARARVPAMFGPVPGACLDVSARRMSVKDEAARRQGYRVVAAPGKSGIYFVDLANIRRRPSWSLPSVVHHELLPGHMIQLPIEQLADPQALRLEYAPAFVEGWAIYAEQLAASDGAFAHDDMALLGHLHWLLFRLARATVDTGIHLKGWSVSQAVQACRQIQGEPAYFAPVAADIDRICLEPGIRAAEALNWLTIADRASQSPRRTGFHRGLLENGRRRLEHLDFGIKRG
ncbi:MAG: DUF885 family protein [Sphingomonas sp.]